MAGESSFAHNPGERSPAEPPVSAAPGSRISRWWRGKKLGPEFWQFLAADFLFDSGAGIFFLLLNLYLLDIGYRERFLGWVASLISAGSIAGSLPAGLLTHHLGLRKTMLLCFGLVPVLFALTVATTWAPLLLCMAFLGGVALSLWGVAEPPVIAQLTDDINRPFAFSVVFAVEVGFGALAALVGGYLPKWIAPWTPGAAGAATKREAVLIACAIGALALWPAGRLRFSAQPAAPREKRIYPRSGFLVRFFTAIAVWQFATGLFNPFYNAYFSHSRGVPVEGIGAISAGSQMVQVAAMLVAPFFFRKFGLIACISYAQLACGAALEWLGITPGRKRAAIAYFGYSGFQWMSDPALYSLLMSQVAPSERAGASAMSMFVTSGVEALAAALGGMAFARFGYPHIILATGGAIIASGLLFRYLLLGTETGGEAGLR